MSKLFLILALAISVNAQASNDPRCAALTARAGEIDDRLDDLAIRSLANVSAVAMANGVNAILAMSGLEKIDIAKYRVSSHQQKMNLLQAKLYAAREGISKDWHQLKCVRRSMPRVRSSVNPAIS